MLKRRRPRTLDEKGMATLEMVPILVVIAILLNFALGFFGVIHTGILNSIAARNYTFETFRHRTTLVFFHDFIEDRQKGGNKRYNSRVHGIASDVRGNDTNKAVATTRTIGFGMNPEDESNRAVRDPASETGGIFSIEAHKRIEDDSLISAPVWVRPMYGICLNNKCSK